MRRGGQINIVSGPRWLLRQAVGAAILAAILSGLWLVWFWEAKRRCDQEIASMRAAGECVTWGQLAGPDVPDAENAAWYLRQAGRSMTGPFLLTPDPAHPRWQPAAEAVVAVNGPALAMVRKARSCRQVCWTPNPGPGGSMPFFADAGALANLVRDAALLKARQGDDLQAIEYWRDVNAHARVLAKGQSFLVQGMVCQAVDRIALDAIAPMAPTLRLGPGGISSDQARQLIAEISDEATIRQPLAQGYLNERIGGTDWYLNSAAGGPLLLRPMMLLQMRRRWVLLRDWADDVRHFRQSRAPVLSEDESFGGVVGLYACPVYRTVDGAMAHRVLSTAMAIRLFHAETGRYPQTLEELIPAYLPRVPLDPRGGDAYPLGYLLEADGRRPMIYSSSQDLATVRKGVPFGSATNVLFFAAVSSKPDQTFYFDVIPWVGEARIPDPGARKRAAAAASTTQAADHPGH